MFVSPKKKIWLTYKTMTEQNQTVTYNPNANSKQDTQFIPESKTKEILGSNPLPEELMSTEIEETAMTLVDLCVCNSNISTNSTHGGEISNSHTEIRSDDTIAAENAPAKKRKRGPYKKRERSTEQGPSKIRGRPKNKNIPLTIPMRMVKINPKGQQNLPSSSFKMQFPRRLPVNSNQAPTKFKIPALKRIVGRKSRDPPQFPIPSISSTEKMPLMPLKSTAGIEQITTHFEMLYLEQLIRTKKINTCIRLGFIDKFANGPKPYGEHPKISQNRILDLIIKPMYPMMVRMRFVYDTPNESPIPFLSSSNPRQGSNQTTLRFCSLTSKNPREMPPLPYVLLEQVHREHITLNLPKEQITRKRRKISIIHLQIEFFTLVGELIGIVKSEPFHVGLKTRRKSTQLGEPAIQVREQIK